MLMEKCLLQFQGFHPTAFSQSYLSERMQSLLLESPPGSTLKAVFKRKNHLIKGIVTVHSSAGRFFAKSEGLKLKEVTHHINEQIRKQLGRWKSRRLRRDLPEVTIDERDEVDSNIS